ncbi:MAG TPA: hypothetical protein VNU92_09735 [Edaphobacter sp.]|jgi:hypothetical protein|nr:hypothetical protein [Edaphobacter sp.]
MSSKRPLLFLLLLVTLLSVAISLRTQVTYPMPSYQTETVEWATNGHVADTFAPLAYPLFAGPAYRFGGDRGIVVLQIFLELALAFVCYWLLRELGLPASWSAYGSLPVALLPDLILSVNKLWDLTLGTVLFLLFVLVCLRIAHNRPRPAVGSTVWAGLILAAAIFCRPNLALLFPTLAVLFLLRRSNLSPGRAAGQIAIFVLVTVAGYFLLGMASHGSAYFPRNGSYNLYAGHNPQTAAALHDHLNAEFSLIPDFYASHSGEPVPNFYSPEMCATYTGRAIDFAIHHPGDEIKLFFYKLFILFHPDTKLHALLSPYGLVKSVLALPVVLFLAVLLFPGRPSITFDDKLLFAFEILYIIPFLLTNSDPRFRTSLDSLLLLHTVWLYYRRRRYVQALA